MKKFLLIISLIFSLLISGVNLQIASAEEIDVNENNECMKVNDATIRIVNKYGVLIGNGFVYKIDDEYAYIITSDKVNFTDTDNSVIYNNGTVQKASFIGKDNYNGIMILKAKKENNIKNICLSNSYLFMPGQMNFLYGYRDNYNAYVERTFYNKQGVLFYKKDYINIYKSIIQSRYEDYKEGMAVADEFGNLVGMVSGNTTKLNENSFIVEVNKLTKIADSIVKSRIYEVNYIKYNLEDYVNLDSYSLNSYKVNKDANYGVVITTFKPLNYIFGGLNQGMVIQMVNSVVVKNIYDLDNQLSRYKKGDTVCLGVVKRNGKVAYYYAKV